MDYQAIISAPFGKLGIRCSDTDLLGIEFLPGKTKSQAPQGEMAKTICAELEAYLADAKHEIDLPFELDGTHHQCNVWQAMLDIPCGQTLTYGELAKTDRLKRAGGRTGLRQQSDSRRHSLPPCGGQNGIGRIHEARGRRFARYQALVAGS